VLALLAYDTLEKLTYIIHVFCLIMTMLVLYKTYNYKWLGGVVVRSQTSDSEVASEFDSHHDHCRLHSWCSGQLSLPTLWGR